GPGQEATWSRNLMSFSERMKESLGVEGARVEVEAPSTKIAPGGEAVTKVRVLGGSREARVDALVMRVVEARRHWLDPDGKRLDEDQAKARSDRRKLMPGWDRRIVHEQEVHVGHLVDPGTAYDLEVVLTVPDGCGLTDDACVVTINAQADIKGQIDPTGTSILLVG